MLYLIAGLIYPAFKDMIDKHYNAPKTKITWGGGEPTVLKNFEKVMDMLIHNDFKQSICTNAIIYSEAIARGLKLNNLSVCISVDSGTRETYYKIKGKDVFNIVWENISKYDMSKKTCSVKYILKQNNSDKKDAEKAAIEVDISYFPSDAINSLVSTNKPRSIYQKSTEEADANL